MDRERPRKSGSSFAFARGADERVVEWPAHEEALQPHIPGRRLARARAEHDGALRVVAASGAHLVTALEVQICT